MNEKLPVARCGDCLYWQEGAGECKGNGFFPHSTALNISLAGWPVTVSNDWCGEFVHRKRLPSVQYLGDTEPSIRHWRFPTEPEE